MIAGIHPDDLSGRGAREYLGLMARRSGSADLPLHGGQVPKWLADRMTRLGAVMTQAACTITAATSCCGGWHIRSGSSVRRRHGDGLAFLRHHHQRHRRAEARADAAAEGARRPRLRRAREVLPQTPSELIAIGDQIGFDGGKLAQASRLVAKVDSAAVQDGFDLYLHGFVVTDDGHWAVVQQGMNEQRRQAQAYPSLGKAFQFSDARWAARRCRSSSGFF